MKRAGLAVAVALVLVAVSAALDRFQMRSGPTLGDPLLPQLPGERATRSAEEPPHRENAGPTDAELTHPAVATMAEFYGEDAAVLVREVHEDFPRFGPRLLESQPVPLADWDSLEPALPQFLADEIFGGDEAATEAQRHELVRECREIMGAYEPSYDSYTTEWRDAVTAKVVIGQFDRFPYMTLSRRRHFTSQDGRDLLVGLSTAVPGSGWAVSLDVYGGDAPAFDLALQAWNTAKEQCLLEVEAVLTSQ